MQVDSKGNSYVEVENIRITYVKQINRLGAKDWPGTDVIRIQAYRGGGTNQMHMGAEYPIYDSKDGYKLIAAISTLFSNI